METIHIIRLSGLKYRVNRKLVTAYGQHIAADVNLTPNEEAALKDFMCNDKKLHSTIRTL